MRFDVYLYVQMCLDLTDPHVLAGRLLRRTAAEKLRLYTGDPGGSPACQAETYSTAR